MILWQALVLGAMFASAAVLLYAGLVPAPPDLHAAMERLRSTGAAEPVASTRGPAWWRLLRARWAPPLIRGLGLRRYAADLAMLDQTVEDLVVHKVGYAVLGAVFPVVVGAGLTVMGVRTPVVVSAPLVVVCAAVLFFVPDLDLRRSARAARDRMRHAVSLYLELVALERLADGGTTQSLERAATIGTTREHDLIRAALLRAELDGRPAWSALNVIAERTGVRELGDVGDIMRVAGSDGAAVYTTLRARAQALRTQLLSSATAAANTASEHMVIPVSLLGVIFMGLIAYPALARIVFG